MTRTGKRLTALLLAVVMVVAFVPVLGTETVYAANHGLSNPRVSDFVNSDGKNDVAATWDCIWFGRYPQSSSTGMTFERIKWRVLSVNGDDAFILSDQNLDCKPYNTNYTDITWEDCTLRSWLNNNFYKMAFNDAAKSAIKTTAVVNCDNLTYGIEGGKNTSDKVFLLSIEEARTRAYGFPEDPDVPSDSRQALNTKYAKAQGACTDTSDPAYSGKGWWWLRSPGYYQDRAAGVSIYGWLNDRGDDVFYDFNAVRPALHIDLSSSAWSYAGTVSSKGPAVPESPPAGPSASPSSPSVEKTILSWPDDNDINGSTFSLLQAKGVPKSKTAVKLTWKKVSGATKYVVYGNKCGKKNRYQKIREVTGTSFTQKKLKKGTYYKYLVVAMRGDQSLAVSKTIHVATKGGKVGNNKKVTLGKKKLTLKKGKSKKVKAKLKAGSLKVKSHRKVAWESDNESIAKVNKKGKITGVKKGTCNIYAYAQNGVFAKVKVTVK